MSLSVQARSAVEAAFAAAGDAIATVTWNRPSVGAYDAATGTRAVTETSLSVRAVEDKVQTTQATRLDLSDRAVRLWIPAVDFEGKGLTTEEPLVTDTFIHRAVTYRTRDRAFEGVKAIWEIHGDV
jgi:hypothetical protein